MLGSTIGNYEVVNRFGEGGMGELYLGRHTRLAREVIIKTIRTDEFSPKQIEHLRVRLEREAYIQSQLDNPNIVRVYDFIATSDATCMVMEYVPGRDLRRMIVEETGPIPADRALRLFMQVLGAIDYAHNFTYADQNGRKYQGIIHRDLKPANILVTPDDVVKVTDFGIVKVRGATGGTQLGFNPGTPEYMSPEQARGRELDQRSDIYSLGVVLYEMLTGRVPFEDDLNATSDYEVRRGHIELPVPRPSEIYPGISLELEKIVLKALEKDPDERFQSAHDFLVALEEFEQTGKAVFRTAPLGGERRTVLQPGRTARVQSPVPANAGTGPGTAPTVARPASVEPSAVTREGIAHQAGSPQAETEVTRIAGQAKSRTPAIIGIAAVVLLAAGFGLYQLMSGASSGTATNASTGGSSAPAMIPGMIRIPGGTFDMGRNDGNEFEGPAHQVTVRPFFIDRTEVTNEQYAAFVTQTRRQPPSNWVNGTFPPGEAGLPVVNVSWEDAKAYAEWAGKRLPTEAEWEFAARGSDGRLYPYGSEWKPRYSNAAEDNKLKPAAVGSYPDGASSFGVLDMAGNVAEWTATDYTPYPGSRAKSQEGHKVVRGGAYNVPARQQTATDRFYYPPSRTESFIGFRCARDAEQGGQ